MKHTCFILFTWLCLGNSAVAQEKEKIKFSSINQAGILKGSSDQTYQLQTINGIKYKTWFAGMGVGLEEYYLKTIPVFIDVRKNLFKHKPSPFLYADLGVSFPSEKEDKGLWQTSVYSKGLYIDVGLGYNIPIKGSLAFNFSAGLSYKKLHEKRIYGHSFGSNGKEYFEYSFRRVSVKVALQF
jgi:hypothetical protein